VPEVTSGGADVSASPLDLDELDVYRGELTGYCYRMLGSGLEAEDAVQETLLRAWRASTQFEGRSSVRAWLYRIATNVCIDMGRHVQRRARPADMGPASPADESRLGPMLPESTWVTPIPDGRVSSASGDPAEIVGGRESVRLAFVAALQLLPPRQRSALILCEVLRWPVKQAAELLDSTPAAVNSSLQRARATLRSTPCEPHPESLDPPDAELLERYVEAFERYDIAALVGLLRRDAVQSMPPFAMWIQGADEIGKWMVQPGPSACRGSRLVAASANGCPAFGQYRRDAQGRYTPWALQVLEISGGRIATMNFFLAPLDEERLFPQFGLPLDLDDEPRGREAQAGQVEQSRHLAGEPRHHDARRHAPRD
jgi:RNA polymerase sigma-70 factor, ECF subfamily